MKALISAALDRSSATLLLLLFLLIGGISAYVAIPKNRIRMLIFPT